MLERLLWLALFVATAVAVRWWANRKSQPRVVPTDGDWNLVYFWGPHCTACLALKSALNVVLEENQSWLRIKSVNAEKELGEARAWSILTVPTLFLTDGRGEIVYRKSGAISLTELRAAISKFHPNAPGQS